MAASPSNRIGFRIFSSGEAGLVVPDGTWPGNHARRPGAMYGVRGAACDVFGSEGRSLGEIRVPPRANLQAAAEDLVWDFDR